MVGTIGSGSSSDFVPLTLDSSLLSQYFNLRAGVGTATFASATPSASSIPPPWDSSRPQPSDSAQLKDALSASKFIQTTGTYFDRADVPDDQKKLFSLYIALSRLDELATSAASDGTVPGLLNSLNARLQLGLSEVTQFLADTKFDALTLLRGYKTNYVQSGGAISPRMAVNYVGAVAQSGDFEAPLAGINGDEVFTISIKKSGVVTDIAIDPSQMGATPRTLGNIVDFINTQLAANAMLTRFKAVNVGDGNGNNKYAIQIANVGTEVVTLSAPAAGPAVYVTGVSGTGAEAKGQVLRLDDSGAGEPTISFSRRIEADKGAVAAKASALDSQGNLYVLGTTQGDLGNESLKGTQDVYLIKYDSTGQVQWTHLLGASGSADGMALAVDANNNVVVAGSVQGELLTEALGGGSDSFVSKFNGAGEELFTRQIAPIKDDAATSLVVGADGAIYVGGWTKGALGGSTAGGGTDGYVTKLDSKGKLVYNREFGGAGEERGQAVALAADGGLLVASLEDGHAILRKYDAASGTGAAVWEKDLWRARAAARSAPSRSMAATSMSAARPATRRSTPAARQRSPRPRMAPWTASSCALRMRGQV